MLIGPIANLIFFLHLKNRNIVKKFRNKANIFRKMEEFDKNHLKVAKSSKNQKKLVLRMEIELASPACDTASSVRISPKFLNDIFNF